jgi:hypothetical protein
LWEKTPDFSYQMPELLWTLRQQVWNWLLLTLWFSAATASAVIAAGRPRI